MSENKEIYWYEKKYNEDITERKAFKTVQSLIDYMNKNQNTLFNAGFRSAEIKLYRVRLENE